MDVHHVGLATTDAAAASGLYGALFDAPVAHEERREGLTVVFLGDRAPYLELLEPDPDSSGPVARFLDRRGPGVHHLAFAVEDVAAALASARASGVEAVDDAPRAGAWGHEVAFLHPNSTDGVLVELVG